MIRLTTTLRRRPGLSLELFFAHWLNVHAPLVRSHADVLGIRKYVQLHTLADQHDDRDAAYDGLAQIWFDSREDFTARMRSTDGKAAARRVREDERLFIDIERTIAWWGSEHVIL